MHLVDRTSCKFKIILIWAAIIFICSKSFTPIWNSYLGFHRFVQGAVDFEFLTWDSLLASSKTSFLPFIKFLINVCWDGFWKNLASRPCPLDLFSVGFVKSIINPSLILRVTDSTNPWSNFLVIPVKCRRCIGIITFRHDNILS